MTTVPKCQVKYTSEKALISLLYPRRERIIIYSISFMNNIHDDLPHIFIGPIGFNIYTIFNFIV